jgi:dUTP pyrophosphatase
MLKKTSKLLERLRNHLNLVPRNHDLEYEVKRSIGVFANLDIRVFVAPALWPKFPDEYWSDSSRDALNAGYDLRACAIKKGAIKNSVDFEPPVTKDGRDGWLLLPYQMYSVNTGVVFEIPEGFYGAVSLRSSFFQSGIAMPSEGKIDASYRGRIWVTIRYMPDTLASADASNSFFLERYDRFAQLIVQPYLKQHIVCVTSQDDLTVTNRGDGGFGSTGRQ